MSFQLTGLPPNLSNSGSSPKISISPNNAKPGLMLSSSASKLNPILPAISPNKQINDAASVMTINDEEATLETFGKVLVIVIK